MKLNLKFIYLVLFVINIHSCGTSPVSKNQDNGLENTESSEFDSATAQATTVKDEKEISRPIKPADAGNENLLNQAIQKQNEFEISKTAQDVLITNPNSLKALNSLGLLNFKKGKTKAAEFFFNKALKSHPNESALYNNLGLIKLNQNENREAINLFKAGLNLNSNDKEILANLGSLYVINKDFSNAEIALGTLYKEGTKDLKIISNYAVALSGNNKMAEATSVYEKALSENQSSREIMLNYSVHLIENLKNNKQGMDLINRLKFVGVPEEARNLIKDLENKAKAGLN